MKPRAHQRAHDMPPEIVWERARAWHEVLEDEQCIANNYLTTVQIPGLGTKKTVGNLVRLSETPGSVKGDPPELGEANNEVLGELGFSADECQSIENHATRVREEFITELMATAAEATRE